VNSARGYSFVLTVVDGQARGGGGADRFRIKIWDKGGTFYDTQDGAPDSAWPTTELGAGKIAIRS